MNTKEQGSPSKSDKVHRFVAWMILSAAASFILVGSSTIPSPIKWNYCGAWPMSAFLLLAAVGYILPREIDGLWGAAIGAILGVAIPSALIWYSSVTYEVGGGADIGTGIFLMGMPFYLPMLMVAGYMFRQFASRSNG